MPRCYRPRQSAAGAPPRATEEPENAASEPENAASEPENATSEPENAASEPEITVLRGPMAASAALAVRSLVTAAAEQDGVGPLSEHVMLHLRHGGDPRGRDLLLASHGELSGYAHLDPAQADTAPSAELVIHPAHRRQGLGLQLTRALVTESAGRPVRLWAHGDLPAAARLAAAAGFERVRALWQMRRSLLGRIERPQLAGGVTVRTFAAGRDESAWADLNSRAFAGHPEQGAWTRSDLDLREQEPWFDPDGFFLAERGGEMVGFHWTKVHHPADAVRGGDAASRAREAIGEVYVVGVDPRERGTGLGRALTLIGLDYLRSLGLPEVMLYVDESNSPAIGLYESLGFTHWGTDVMYEGSPGYDETDAPAPGRTPRT